MNAILANKTRAYRNFVPFFYIIEKKSFFQYDNYGKKLIFYYAYAIINPAQNSE